MLNHTLLNLLAALCYVGIGVAAWRIWHPKPRANQAANQPSCTPSTWAGQSVKSGDRLAKLLIIPLLLQGSALYQLIYPQQVLHFSFSLALAMMAWLAIGIYWLESFRLRLAAMLIPLTVMALCSSLLPEIFAHSYPILGYGAYFNLHFIIAMLAYSFITLAALQGAFMSFVESVLHRRVRHVNQDFIAQLPSLLSMEQILFRMISSGFVLLTIVIISGFFYAEHIVGRPFRFDHKTIFACLSWLVFATLLIGHYAYGWRGRIARIWTSAGFLFLILAYVGTRFVIEIILQRA